MFIYNKNTDMSHYIVKRPYILKEATYTLETDSHLTLLNMGNPMKTNLNFPPMPLIQGGIK